jgi:hypothetical protein
MLFKLFTPSNVIATLALFVSLGSGAYAATQLDGHTIKNHSIPAVKLTRSAVVALHGQRGPRGYSGRNGVNGTNGPQGAQGPQGATGPQGAPGTNGVNGVNGTNGGFDPAKLQYVAGPDVSIAAGSSAGATANCPVGTTAISGGFFGSIGITAFSETFGPTFHGIYVENDSSITITVHATVVCSAK